MSPNRLSLFSVLILFSSIVNAQLTSIKDVFKEDFYYAGPTQSGLLCLYKTNRSTAASSVFRSLVLNEKLEKTDTQELNVEGDARLISYLKLGPYHLYAFSVTSSNQVSFIVVNDSGKIQANYKKREQDFEVLFKNRLGRVDDLNLTLIAQENNPEVVVAYPTSGRKVGKIFGFELLSGRIKWTLAEPLRVAQTLVTDNRLIVISEETEFADNYPSYSLQFFDLFDGSLIRCAYFGEPNLRRTIGAFTSVARNILVLGDEFVLPKKVAHLFTFIYDLDGNLVHGDVAQKANKLDLLYQGLGTSHDEDGNTLVFGESFRRTKVKGVSRSAYQKALLMTAFASPGIVFIPNFNGGHFEDVIENLKVLKISRLNMDVIDTYTFQSEMRTGFSRFYSFDEFAIIRTGEKIWIYDLREPSTPPRLLSRLSENKELILTPFGPVSLENEAGTMVLEKLLSE